MTHNFRTRYAETDLGEVADTFTVEAATDGRGLVVRGECPRCKGPTRTQWRLGMPGSGTKGVTAETVRDEPRYCECGYAHAPQPANSVFVGCGASWRVAR